MLKKLIFIITTIFVLCGSLPAADAVSFLISIYEKDNSSGQNVLLYSDRAVIRNGVAASAFLTGFSVDIEITSLDTERVEFNVHTVTLGAKGRSFAKSFKSEYRLPAIMSNIEIKPGAIYSLTLQPESLVTVPDRECNYDHNKSSGFTLFPSANFDLHYLESSLASYHASSLKLLYETEYRAFRDMFHFNITSKPAIYCFPCPVNSVIWDFRFGTAIDPTRNNGYTLYHTGLNTSDPFVLISTAILRSYGYAPKFLTDGWAGYYSMALHKMKLIKQDNKNLPLATLLTTHDYLNAKPDIAEASAATFVRYLIDQYDYSNFRNLFESTDDLNLLTQIEQVYGKNIDVLEQEWLNYIDTTHVLNRLYGQFAQRAEQMLNYPLMLEYSKIFVGLADNERDSVQCLDQLARAYYFTGDYYGAVEAQSKLAQMEPKNAEHRIGLAAYRMMNGEFEKAYEDLKHVEKIEPDNPVLRFNLALNWLERGDSAKAQEILEKFINSATSYELQGEARTLLGYILRKSKNAELKLQAKDHFTIAIAYFNQQIQTNPAVPSPYMWTGIALLGMDDADNAYEELSQALFLESRPFYNGMINLWLGKAADLRNQHKLAADYYSEVIAIESAVYHQKQAHAYLEKPYKQ